MVISKCCQKVTTLTQTDGMVLGNSEVREIIFNDQKHQGTDRRDRKSNNQN